MIPGNVVKFREARSRVAVAYSSKDRQEFTRQTIVKLLDNPNVDLFWFDGSASKEGRSFPLEVCIGHDAPCELHQGVTGGAEVALLYALLTLEARDYDLVIVIENDVLLADRWYDELLLAIERATNDGFNVGAATARIYASRVLSFNGGYSLMFNAGAGFIALTRRGLSAVVSTFRTCTTQEVRQIFLYLANVDLSETWESTLDGSHAQPMSADWYFEPTLYMLGMVVVAPAVTYARNLDDQRCVGYTKFVIGVEDHLAPLIGRVTHPAQLRVSAAGPCRFQNSPTGDKAFLPCHHLRMVRMESPDAGTEPVVLTKGWSCRNWQMIGPFEMFGSGRIVITNYGFSVHCLIHTRDETALVNVAKLDGSRVIDSTARSYSMEPNSCYELPLSEGGGYGEVYVLEICAG